MVKGPGHPEPPEPPEPPAPEYDPLVVGDPVATGEPVVGETLTCSEPSVEGGSGDVLIQYYWQDANNKRVFDMGSTHEILITDVLRTMQCMVAVSDVKTGEAKTVYSNSLGPVLAPVIGNITLKVEGNPYDFDNGDVIDALNGEDFLMQVITDGDPGVSYTWEVRQGQARLSPSGSTCIATMQSEPPQGVQVQCNLINNNAPDSPKSARFAFFVGNAVS